MKQLVFLLSLSFLFTHVKSQISANPNPCDKRTLLSYTLPGSDTVSLVVYDVLGHKIITIRNNEFLTAGSYQDSLILDTFNPGSYYATIERNNSPSPIALCKVIKTGATSIPVIGGTGEIKLFPNPTTQKAHIDLGSMKNDLHVSLYDEIGRLVFEDRVSGNALDIDLGPYTHGLYTLKLSEGPEQKIYKLVKE